MTPRSTRRKGEAKNSNTIETRTYFRARWEFVMKKIMLSAVLAVACCFSAFAQTPPAKADAVTATCKDGTPYSGATSKGACRGHGGVDKKAGAAAPPAAPEPAAKPAKAAKAEAPAQAAAGGGAGKVWVNTDSKVYHCPGGRWYGKTKAGEYMSESEAKAKGNRADHGKACA